MFTSWSELQEKLRESQLIRYKNLDVHVLVCDRAVQELLWVWFQHLLLSVLQYVLAVGSSVFGAMFYGDLAEGQAEIHIPDVQPAAFLILLK